MLRYQRKRLRNGIIIGVLLALFFIPYAWGRRGEESISFWDFAALGLLEQSPGIPDLPTLDYFGYPIIIPDVIHTVVTIGTAPAEIITAIGFGDKIVGTDAAALYSLNPDIVFASGVPDATLREAGIPVLFFPERTSIGEITDDIALISLIMDNWSGGMSIVADINEFLRLMERTNIFHWGADPYAHLAHEAIRPGYERLTVQFIADGTDAGLFNALITLINAIPTSTNPDIILTNIYPPPVTDAIFINTPSQPTAGIIDTIIKIAQAVYPEIFGDITRG